MATSPYFRYNAGLNKVEIGPGLDAPPYSGAQGTGTTADGAAAVLCSATIPLGRAARITATAFANSGAGSATASVVVTARVRNPDGTPQVTVDSGTTNADAGLELVAADLVASANLVQWTATGVAGHTLAWSGAVEFLLV